MRHKSDYMRLKTLDGEIIEHKIKELKRRSKSNIRHGPHGNLVDVQCPKCGENFKLPYYIIKTNSSIICPRCSNSVRTEQLRLIKKNKAKRKR